MRLLKRRQSINRSTYFGGVAFPERNELSHGSVVFGDDESFAFLNSAKKSWKVRFRIECADY